jgi:kynurenine formamidase
MIQSLSYPLSADAPFYEGLDKPAIERLYDLSRGDVCNSFYFRSSNHCGTHVDAPWHFNATGRKICDYDISELVFERLAILDVAAGPAHLIQAADLTGAANLRHDCDLLLVRTGFGQHRADERKYVDESPGFSRNAAEYLMRELPHLRALAVDFISVASSRHADEGCEAHRVFLGCAGYSDRAVLLIEDAKLPPDLRTPSRVIVAPWYFEGLDSAPCNVIAEFSHE